MSVLNIDHFVAITLSIIPWLSGASSGALFAKSTLNGFSGLAIRAGVGGFIGYVLMATFFSMASLLGFASEVIFTVTISFFTTNLFINCFWLISRRVQIGKVRTVHLNLVCFVLIVLTLLLFIWRTAIHNSYPLSGWDVMDFWGPMSIKVVEDTLVWYHYLHRHPLTDARILAWPGWVSKAMEIGSLSFWPWAMLSVSLCLTTFGICSRLVGHKIAVIALTLVMTIPLIENHFLLAGYAENWLAFSVTAATGLIAIGVSEEKSKLIFVGLTLSLTSLLFKNTGPLYASIPILSYLFSCKLEQQLRQKVLLLSVVLVSLPIAYIFFRDLKLEVFGKELKLISGPLRLIFYNQVHAWIFNSTFNVIFISYAVVVIGTIFAKPQRGDCARRLYFVATNMLLFSMTISQIFEYPYLHATPQNDTGNSRFSIPLAVLMLHSVAATMGKYIAQQDGTTQSRR